MRFSVMPALLLVSGLAAAQEPAPAAPPPPPLSPEQVTPSGTETQPQVTITHRGGAVIQEYRVQGRIYMVKITPPGGAPYYLIDRNGDGRLETFRNDLYPPNVVQWKILQW